MTHAMRRFCLGDDIKPVDYLEEHGVLDWRDVRIQLGQLGETENGKGTRLGSLNKPQLVFWIENYKPEKYHGKWVEKDLLLDAALCVVHRELSQREEDLVYAS